MTKTALILLDYINEIVDPAGKLAAKGYAEYIEAHDVYGAVNGSLEAAKASDALVVAVALGFQPSYSDQPTNSPIFGKAAEFEILRRETWSTAYTDQITLPADCERLTKNRVSAFTATSLDRLLRNQGVTTVRLAGVATDLAVEATARSAHDLDYTVEILSASCAAANEDDHLRALTAMSKFSTVV